ncbi:MAG: asparaginase [Clostridia bacterium]|nr:asparaginase [Clostridia bacterium]
MKILVIFTGGTIGSKENDGWIGPNSTTKSLLINTYKQNSSDDIVFDTVTPYEILSENLDADNLTALIDCLFDNAYKGYEGIIVCHGTDTLQYSSAAAAYCLGFDVCPVVFVSANYPLNNKKTNGHINFKAAVQFIKSGNRGVFVSYSNDLKTADIHLAHKLFVHREYEHQVFSLGGPVAVFKDGGVEVLKKQLSQGITPFGRVNFAKHPGILNITVTPFEEYNYNLKGVKAVVLTPYHSGTVNTKSPAFVEFCKKAKQAKIPIVLTGVSDESLYESMQTYSELGVEVLKNTTQTAARVLLWIKLSL